MCRCRAFKHAQDFVVRNYGYLNRNTSALFAFHSSARWLGFRLDLGSILFTAICTYSAVGAKEGGAHISPSVLAVGILYVTQLTGLFQWMVRQSAEVENLMISVERIISYAK
jgi:ATP-binding cassette subfamily C (CFTR/MRP) protein 4